jgi:N-acetylglucosamine-6-phosphate deacetylase
MIEFIFSIKDPERIIIVSDTVKDAKKTPGSSRITDENNKLLGGSMTNRESADRLIKKGFDKDVILKCITENPERYLRKNN